MSKPLVSVCNLTECQIALDLGIPLIDLKDPSDGALGALPLSIIKQLVQLINQQTTISATIGNLSLSDNHLIEKVMNTWRCGVDFIKVGFYSFDSSAKLQRQLSSITPDVKLVAVIFAEDGLDFDILSWLNSCGFAGVMLDTRVKNKRTLCDHISVEQLNQFVQLAKFNHLYCGLAGSLTFAEVPKLLALGADYLGFRGALCDNARSSKLNPEKIETLIEMMTSQVTQYLPNSPSINI